MTTVDEAFPSNYLKAADLQGRNVKLKIASVIFEEIGQYRDKKPIIRFANVKKGLVLNKTNAKAIESVHGKVFEGWTGKEIELYPAMVPFQGQDVPAIRVRVETPERPQRDDFNAPLGTQDPSDPLGI